MCSQVAFGYLEIQTTPNRLTDFTHSFWSMVLTPFFRLALTTVLHELRPMKRRSQRKQDKTPLINLMRYEKLHSSSPLSTNMSYECIIVRLCSADIKETLQQLNFTVYD